jgi:hypothetical protein
MGNRRLHKAKRIHMLGTPESERLKVAALNLFHPTTFPLFERIGFFHIALLLRKGKDTIEGISTILG